MRYFLILIFASCMLQGVGQSGWTLYRGEGANTTATDTLQKQAAPVYVEGSLRYVFKDARLDSLTATLVEDQDPTIPGYRIQLMFGTDKKAIEKSRREFEDDFEELPGYIDYLDPNFRLRIGDFRTKLDAAKYLKAIKASYAGAYIVPCRINLPPLY